MNSFGKFYSRYVADDYIGNYTILEIKEIHTKNQFIVTEFGVSWDYDDTTDFNYYIKFMTEIEVNKKLDDYFKLETYDLLERNTQRMIEKYEKALILLEKIIQSSSFRFLVDETGFIIFSENERYRIDFFTTDFQTKKSLISIGNFYNMVTGNHQISINSFDEFSISRRINRDIAKILENNNFQEIRGSIYLNGIEKILHFFREYNKELLIRLNFFKQNNNNAEINIFDNKNVEKVYEEEDEENYDEEEDYDDDDDDEITKEKKPIDIIYDQKEEAKAKIGYWADIIGLFGLFTSVIIGGKTTPSLGGVVALLVFIIWAKMKDDSK